MTDTSGGNDPPDIDPESSPTQAWLEAMDIINNSSFQFEQNGNFQDSNYEVSNMSNMSNTQKRPLNYDSNVYDSKKINPSPTPLPMPTPLKPPVLLPLSSPVPSPSLFPCPSSLPLPSSTPLPSPLSSPNTNSVNAATKSSVSPYELNKLNRFSDLDRCKYIVIIESTVNNIGLLHHMSLGKLLINYFSLKNEDIVDIQKEGRNRIKLQLRSGLLINNILNSDVLSNYNLRAYIPESVLYRKGVIRHVDTSLSIDELKEVIQSKIEINNIRRISKVVSNNNDILEKVNTQTIVVNFRGQYLPDFVTIYGAKCYVQPYVYKVVQCQNCLRFGHTGSQCRSSPRCNHCGEKHQSDSCKATVENPQCINCKGAHNTSSKSCPVFLDQQQIKKYMAYNNVGFKEAKLKFRSFSQVASSYKNYKENEFPPLTSNRYELLADNVDIHTELQPNIQPFTFRNSKRFNKNNINKSHSTNFPNNNTKSQSISTIEKESRKNSSPIVNPFPPMPHLINANQNSSLESSNNPKDIVISFCSLLLNFISEADGPAVDKIKLSEYISAYLTQVKL